MIREKEFVPLTNDLLFKEALCHKDNREQLIYFLRSITKFDEKTIRKNLTVKYESILSKTKLKDKNFRGDIIIKFDKYYVNLEGYSNFDKNSLAKSTSYIMRIFSTQLDRGIAYDNLESILQINIIENDETNLFKDFINEYCITNVKDLNNKILPEKFSIKYYNLDKIKDASYNELNDELRWIRFIGAKTKRERNKIAKGNKMLMDMDNWIEEYVNDEKTKKIFGEWGEYIALEKGFKKGIKKGKIQGAFDKTIEIAKSLKEKNYDIEVISEITKLSIEEIKKLK